MLKHIIEGESSNSDNLEVAEMSDDNQNNYK